MIAALLAAAACHVGGHAPFVTPDNVCTPGAYVRKTRADVCDGDTFRPNLQAAERRVILSNYGLATFTGADGELDHRVPLVLGGVTDRRNIWPEPEPVFNTKDRLEAYVKRRVCDGKPYPMRVTTAVRLFLGNWVHAYGAYFGG